MIPEKISSETTSTSGAAGASLQRVLYRPRIQQPERDVEVVAVETPVVLVNLAGVDYHP